ncbi:MAG: NADH:ubiquinone reductase (Na(+)-transporting) subunit C [Bacteroidales bacterium]|jgi:Na+-transporting NADH:ubiquinone oxidoreductase subunit C|nr:NADH:ubiquinone reductase (Na(+)-transporting) subunit C [Bacteroidales bacterium]
MNTNSNTYIFIYASVMVIIVAAVLSTAATLLKDRQLQNVKNEKMQAILASANIESTPETAETLYNQFITEEWVINQTGEITDSYKASTFEIGSQRAFYLNLKTELYRKSKGEEFYSPLFVCNVEGETYYIIPLLGKGLWGPVWGNIALKSDFTTVKGVVFDHKGETPGLGAEIIFPAFTDPFVGKTIFDEEGNFTSIKVVKGGAKILPANQQIHGVDAISGGTITSNSVNDMLKDCLENYVSYIKSDK